MNVPLSANVIAIFLLIALFVIVSLWACLYHCYVSRWDEADSLFDLFMKQCLWMEQYVFCFEPYCCGPCVESCVKIEERNYVVQWL
ncbi:hypothetical protein TYRP_019886 [Tyrophagus putrescentiae]|nr:hypothetical protein TYRP_019886 [Tyrophagus putrescentiae]